MSDQPEQQIPSELFERIETRVREDMLEWLKSWIKRWRAIALVVLPVLSALGAGGLAWKLFDASVQSEYEALSADVKESLDELDELSVSLRTKLEDVDRIAGQSSESLGAIQRAKGEAETAIRTLRDETFDSVSGTLTRELTPLKSEIEAIKQAGVARQRALSERKDFADQLRADLGELRELIDKTRKQVDPFDEVSVSDLEKLIKMDPWDIKLNALRALGTKQEEARGLFADIVDLAMTTNDPEIGKAAWGTAEAVFHPEDSMLRHCVAALTRGNTRAFEQVQELLLRRLDTDAKKRASVAVFAAHLRGISDLEGKGRVIMVMAALFTQADTESLLALRTAFRGVLGEDLELLLSHRDGNVQNRAVSLAKLIGAGPGWTGGLLNALGEQRSYPFALQIIGAMESVPPELIRAIREKLDVFPTHRVRAEEILRAHGGGAPLSARSARDLPEPSSEHHGGSRHA